MLDRNDLHINLITVHTTYATFSHDYIMLTLKQQRKVKRKYQSSGQRVLFQFVGWTSHIKIERYTRNAQIILV